MALNVGAIQASLGLNTDGYARGILRAQSLNALFGASFAQFVANPVIGGIQIMRQFSGAAVRTATRVLEAAESVERLSQQTGLATDTLQAAARAMEVAGYQAAQAEQALGVFALRFGQARDAVSRGQSSGAFEKLGLDLRFIGESERAMRIALDRIAQLPNEADRAAASAELFGRQAGPLLVNAIGGGSDALDGMIDRYRRMGIVLDADAIPRLAVVNTNLGLMKQAIEGIKQSAAAGFLEGFTGGLGDMEESIVRSAELLNGALSPAMEKFGGYVRDVADGIKFLADAWEGSWIQRGRSGLVDYLGDALTPWSASGAMGDHYTPMPGAAVERPITQADIDRIRADAAARSAGRRP